MLNYDIVIFCATSVAQGMGAAFTRQLKDQEVPAYVLWTGTSAKQPLGIVILEWEDEVPTDFVQQLDMDEEILSYALYPIVVGEAETAGEYFSEQGQGEREQDG